MSLQLGGVGSGRLLGNPWHLKPAWGLLPVSQTMEQASHGGFEHAVPSCDWRSHSRLQSCSMSFGDFQMNAVSWSHSESFWRISETKHPLSTPQIWQLVLEINGDKEDNCSLPPTFGSGSSGCSDELTDSIAMS